jgi:hypothetical protein
MDSLDAKTKMNKRDQKVFEKEMREMMEREFKVRTTFKEPEPAKYQEFALKGEKKIRKEGETGLSEDNIVPES